MIKVGGGGGGGGGGEEGGGTNIRLGIKYLGEQIFVDTGYTSFNSSSDTSRVKYPLLSGTCHI